MGVLALEILTYNPNYKMVVITRVQFESTNSGLVVPSSSSRGFRTSIYDTNEDKFRAFLEVLFVLYILSQNLKMILAIWKFFKESYEQDLKQAN